MYVVGKAMARAIGEDVSSSQLDIREDRKRTKTDAPLSQR